ncbi:uncharacterized protein LOC109835724 isoform X1 [Asparagus officinalis]|uniref:uncharacterized protein LOC109835724 isoform X1 n=1 Tax=Asparagus officinalis TaxID=4686 RepID=UPI00098E7ED1|nr:uncharacterized protein LOC109835724 isoform X1 [Asparagus officinalis]
MLGSSLQLTREDRFHNSARARRGYANNHLSSRAQNPTLVSRTKPSTSPNRSSSSPSNNLDRFLDSTTPSVPAHYLSKTRMRGWRECDVEYRPYFVLGDLWESFVEWSAYGAGVPLLLDDRDCVVQYYAPYLSGMQLYGDSSVQLCGDLRQPGEESDSDCCRDSSSDGSSDYEHEGGLRAKQWSRNHLSATSMPWMNWLSLRECRMALHDGFSSDDGEAGNALGCLLFEYLEHDPPYCREPLADKISDLTCRFPELKSLRSCDLLPASWISIAWYPIYRIPTGPTLKDLDACFLTFHSLSTPVKVGAGSAPDPVVTYSHGGVDSIPKISLPTFGLASYKFKASMWTPKGESKSQCTSLLLEAADSWLRLLGVHHPDYQFFVSHSSYQR